MKVRQGFVSNSSSSSFIVAVKPKEVCPTCGRSDDILIKAFENFDENPDYLDSTALVAKDEDIYNAILEEWGEDYISDDLKSALTQVDEILAAGYRVFYINVNYHDAIAGALVEDPKVKILFGSM